MTSNPIRNKSFSLSLWLQAQLASVGWIVHVKLQNQKKGVHLFFIFMHLHILHRKSGPWRYCPAEKSREYYVECIGTLNSYWHSLVTWTRTVPERVPNSQGMFLSVEPFIRVSENWKRLSCFFFHRKTVALFLRGGSVSSTIMSI